MIVAIDVQLTVGTATGAGVYARDLAAAVAASGIEVRALQAAWLDPWRFDRRVLWDQVLLPAATARSGADVLHATSGTLPLVRGVPVVVTVHDLAWLRVQGHTRGYARAYFGAAMRRAYSGAAAVIVDSVFSQAEYARLTDDPRPPQVVYPGVADRYAMVVRRPAAEPFGLVVGTVEARKNVLAAVEAIASVPGLRLVCVGPPTPYLAAVRARIAELGLGERVDIRGYVDDAVLDELYATATLAVVPSRYEGFGYAVAEARCAGVPFVAARGSSLTEVAGDAGLLVEPDDAAGWVDALRDVLEQREAYEARAAAGRARAQGRFRWSAAATAIGDVYARVLNH